MADTQRAFDNAAKAMRKLAMMLTCNCGHSIEDHVRPISSSQYCSRCRCKEFQDVKEGEC